MTLAEKIRFDRLFDLLVEEAELLLTLLEHESLTGKKLLEIGSGVGLVYGFLKRNGVDVYGLEPSDSGFDGCFEAAIALFKIIAVDGSHFYPYLAQDCQKIGVKFDLIFSNNVLEHIPELETALIALTSVLSPGGKMIHNTVNYHVPYEPHFGIWLVPFVPQKTELFRPSLRQSSLWRGLIFITTSSLRRFCNEHQLEIRFRRDRLRLTLARLETDPAFCERQKIFVPLYRLLVRTRLLQLLDLLPIAMTTPITFTLTHRATKDTVPC